MINNEQKKTYRQADNLKSTLIKFSKNFYELSAKLTI